LLKDWSLTPTLRAGFGSRLRSTARFSFALLCVLTILASPRLKPWAMPALRETSAAADAPELGPQSPSLRCLDGTGTTFNVTWSLSCQTPPAEAVTALEYAAGLWGTWISSTVPIEVTACWTANLSGGDALGTGTPTKYVHNFASAPLVNTYYPIALANALSGRDLEPTLVDMALQFDANATWSFEMTTTLRARALTVGEDFVTVALHEMAHGLGFIGNMYEDYGVGFCGNGPYGFLYPCPTPYDWFAVDNQDIQLLSYLSSNPIELGTRLESDASFGGPNTIVANGGTTARLYTPNTWQLGSSLSHLDLNTFQATENRLMTPSYSGIARHPGPVTLAIFQDMGWLRADGAPNVISSGPQVVVVGHEAVFGVELDWIGHTGQAITYTWTVADRDAITHTARGITDSATLSWTVLGPKIIAVTAVVSGTLASATRSVLVVNEALFLPLVQRY
jgi:hypothetical protein